MNTISKNYIKRINLIVNNIQDWTDSSDGKTWAHSDVASIVLYLEWVSWWQQKESIKKAQDGVGLFQIWRNWRKYM